MQHKVNFADPRWQARKEQVLRDAGHQCVQCGDTTTPLHVSFDCEIPEEPWNLPYYNLSCLCSDCYQIELLDLTPTENSLWMRLVASNRGKTDVIKEAIQSILSHKNRSNG